MNNLKLSIHSILLLSLEVEAVGFGGGGGNGGGSSGFVSVFLMGKVRSGVVLLFLFTMCGSHSESKSYHCRLSDISLKNQSLLIGPFLKKKIFRRCR